MSLKLLLRHLQNTVLHFDGREHRTPRHLLDMGIALCSDCGTFLPGYPGDNACPFCRTVALVIADDIQSVITVAPPKPGPPRKMHVHVNYDNPDEPCPYCGEKLRSKAPTIKRCYQRHKKFRAITEQRYD